MSYKKREQINKDKVYIDTVLRDIPRMSTFKEGKNVSYVLHKLLVGVHKDLAKNN